MTKALYRVAFILYIAVSVVGFASPAKADESNKLTYFTFSAPVELPGNKVLPAGTYAFKLLDSAGDRNIVQIFNKDLTMLYATVVTIPDYRPQPHDKTIIKFSETSPGGPEAIKEWFYPGDNYGQEFVYPKQRAVQLAAAANEPVPAMAVESTDLTTAPIVAVTPQQEELPVTQAIQTAPPAAAVQTQPAPDPAPMAETEQLPKTGSSVPLIALLGAASLGIAFILKRFIS